jgi:lipopolysaccharide transport system ATP-binding protein
MAGKPIVRFENVSKRFRIHHERARSIQDLLVSGFRRRDTSEEFWALRDISFVAEPGVSLGIIGSNGSGKSTLLKLLTRILTPTSGRITVDGRVSALLELGAGFHPELSGRDNVFLNASILGLPRRDVASRFDAIVRFAGLERFIDIPVKHYSSGMYARLGFAVAINVDPDILLIDEVLSVGDEAFQDRCLEAIRRFHQAGKTLILVSHDVASVCNICTDCLWISEGQIRAHGSPRIVVADYQASAHGLAASNLATEVGNPDLATLMPSASGEVPDRWGSGEVEILEVDFLNMTGKASATYRAGDSLTIRVRYRAHERIDRPVFGIGINTVDNVHVTGPNTKADDLTIAAIAGEGCVTYDIRDLPLQPGEYRVSVSIYDESCTHAYDYHDRRYAFRVLPSAPGPQYGVLRLPASWNHQPIGGVTQDEIGSAGLRGSGV